MTAAYCAGLTGEQIEAIAWSFLCSEFTHQNYATWSLDRRIDAYLQRQGLEVIINDGSTFDRLTERVMANMGRALRAGFLGPAKAHRGRHP
ncbi:hypothetical protein JYB55_07620 [Mycolicibacterium septicum]|nr:hypothetical protein [Mycolicibacterium septicum]